MKGFEKGYESVEILEEIQKEKSQDCLFQRNVLFEWTHQGLTFLMCFSQATQTAEL